MSYFNPRVYCYDNLNETGKDRMRFYDSAVHDCLFMLDNIIVDIDDGDTLSKIKVETLESARKELVQLMECSWIENIVALIDNDDSEEDVKELETYQVPDWFADEDEDE